MLGFSLLMIETGQHYVLKPKQSSESFKVWVDEPEPMSLEITEPQKDDMVLIFLCVCLLIDRYFL